MGERAIVIGGSMAGLLAARVLADHFQKVTVVEKDDVCEGPGQRKGVPQGAHVHTLLLKGQEIVSELLPGLREALVAGGAIEMDAGIVDWYQSGVWKLRVPTGWRGLLQSRPFLEWEVRRRVSSLPNVDFLWGGKTAGLLAAANGREIEGVKVERKTGGSEDLRADLVVDASGRGSQAPQWLAALGFPVPEQTEVESGVAYVTRVFRRVRAGADRPLIIYPAPPEQRRFGIIFPVEGGRWICSLGGYLGDHPPGDEAGFLEFARSLPVGDLYETIRGADPDGAIQRYRIPGSRRRHYERLRRRPERFIVLGDALCSFNPLYGQGMTVAALEAKALDACIREQRSGGLRGLSRRFQKRAAKVVDDPWTLAIGEDFQYPETKGRRPFGTSVVNAYVARIHRAVARDPEVLLAFYRVVHMLARPASLFRPSIVMRALAPWRGERGNVPRGNGAGAADRQVDERIQSAPTL